MKIPLYLTLQSVFVRLSIYKRTKKKKNISPLTFWTEIFQLKNISEFNTSLRMMVMQNVFKASLKAPGSNTETMQILLSLFYSILWWLAGLALPPS